MKKLTPLAFGLLASGLLITSTAAAASTLRIATLAPKNSTYGKGFVALQKAIEAKTGGELSIDVFYNGVSGMESTMVSKMKTGQLDGGALSSLGLGVINRDVGIMSLPFLIDTWAKLDKVRGMMESDIEQGFDAQGFRVMGWSDLGLIRGFTKGFAITAPSDIRGKRPMVYRDEPVGPTFFSALGGVTPVPLGVSEILPALQSGTINMVSAPSLAAEQLQWVPHFTHVSSEATAAGIGGFVMTKKALSDLPADMASTLIAMADRLESRNRDVIRNGDEEAFTRIKHKMTLTTISESGRKEFTTLVTQTLKRLSQGTYDRAKMAKVAKALGYSI